MAREWVLVELDDDLVARLDAVATAEGATRVDLLRRGALAVIDAHREIEADRRLREAYIRLPQSDEEIALARAATRMLIEDEPW